MNDNVVVLETKIEVGSVVASGLKRRKATVLNFVDSKYMTVRWESTGEEAVVLRIAFVLA